MKLIVITSETFFEREAAAINLLFENGLETLHLRKPFASQPETEVFIEQIRKDYHPRIVLHDYYGLTERYDLKGIHLNRRNQEAFHGGERRFSISRSCHSLEEILVARFCDYVFLSPIFDSVSKVGYKQAFTPQQLEEAKVRNMITERVIALGGITAKNIPIAQQYGFGGIAVLGALWSDYPSNGNDRELLKRFNELKMVAGDF